MIICARARAESWLPARRSSPTAMQFSARPDGVFVRNSVRTDRFSIKGLSWFGAEGAGACPDGLWQRPAAALLDHVKQYNFNALRLPLAVDNVLRDPLVNQWAVTANPSFRGMRSLQVVERVVQMAAARELLVMLDMHRLVAAMWPTPHGLWHDPQGTLPAERLEEAWRKLARRFCKHWNVMAADLFVPSPQLEPIPADPRT